MEIGLFRDDFFEFNHFPLADKRGMLASGRRTGGFQFGGSHLIC
jgi:hypothetical protein